MILDDKLINGDLIILDGAMGTEIRKFGAILDPVVWSGAANLHYPDAVRGVHEAYIRAGADIITTNTFATCRHVLAGAGLDDRTVENNQRATELAMQARHNAATGRDVAIAGSLSGMNPFVPGTITYDPRYRPDKEARAENLAEQANILSAAGVDFLVLEMMFNVETSLLAAKAAEETGLPVWVGLSASLTSDDAIIAWNPVIEHPREETSENDNLHIEFVELIDAFAEIDPQVMGVMHSSIQATPPALALLGA